MKKKLTATLLAIASTVFIAALSGCNLSWWLLKPETPTVESIRNSIRNWNVELPENIELVYYATELGPRGDGWYYDELRYDGYYKDFNAIFIKEKNETFEKFFKIPATQSLNSAYKNTPDDFTLPDLSDDYWWIMINNSNDKYERIDKFDQDTIYDNYLCILYIKNQRKLSIARYKL